MIVVNHDRFGSAHRKGRVALLLAGLLAFGAAAPAIHNASAETATAAPDSTAKRLLAVESRPSSSGIVLVLKADGRVGNAQSFTLADPARLVIDLPGIANGATASRLDVNSQGVNRVRVAQHDGKVRVVVDGAADAFQGSQLVPTDEGLYVLLKGATAPVANAAPASEPAKTAAAAPANADAAKPAAAKTAAPAAPVAATAAPAAGAKAKTDAAPAAADAPKATAKIVGLQFDVQPSRDRLAIASEAAAKYEVVRPDANTLEVRFPNATIDPKAAVQKFTPEGAATVQQVSAFQQPDAKTPEVRIVITRAPGVEPTLTREGALLLVDFAKGSTQPPASAEAVAGTVPAVAKGSAAAPSLAASQPVTRAKATPAAPPAAAAAAAAPGASAGILEEGGLVSGKTYTGRRISLDFKDVDINDVLRLIAEVSDLNVIAGDDVKGKVTIRLVDVPWDQALDVILLTKGLGFVRVGNVLRIAPSDLLKTEEEARLQEKRAKEKLEDLQVRLLPVNYANVTDVEKMTKRLLSARGSVNVDKRTNTLVVKDIPSVLNETESLVKSLDTQTPQVLIEAKIVEANLDFSRELGAEWAFGANPDSDAQDWNIGGIQPITTKGTTFPFQGPNNVIIENPIKAVPTGILNLSGFLLDDRLAFQLRLAASESDGETKTISSPRVVTLDNREAKIEQGVSIPFQTFENGDAKLEFIDAVLSLIVTPHITSDKSIIMKIEVSRNAPVDVPNPTGSPSIAKNQAKTETLVKDGQTLVLGGIYVVDKSDTQSRTPYLYKIPILGNAFKSDRTSDKRKELLIFVTPQIVHGATTTASAAP